jgi:hypothetical protein
MRQKFNAMSKLLIKLPTDQNMDMISNNPMDECYLPEVKESRCPVVMANDYDVWGPLNVT